MTLKKELNEKVRQEKAMALLEEIKTLFLRLDYTELTKEFTFRIFCHSPKNSPLYYVRANDDRGIGIKFSHDYDIEILEAVMSICETNSINIERENNTSFLITYKP